MPGPVLGHGDSRLEAGTHRPPISSVRVWAAAALVGAVALLTYVATTPFIDVDVLLADSVNEDGTHFDAEIPEFTLAMPRVLH